MLGIKSKLGRVILGPKMSLIAKIAERVIEPIVERPENMLISGNPNLISPAPVAAASLPLAVIFGLALAALVGVAMVRHYQIRVKL